MNKKTLVFSIFLLAFTIGNDHATQGLHKYLVTSLEPTELQSKVCMIVTGILEKYHYRKININDSLSSLIFDRYLESLDNSKLYFLNSDIKMLEKYRYTLDDAFISGNLAPAFEIYNLYQERFETWNNYALLQVNKSFDFTRNETYRFDRTKAPWAITTDDLNDLWRKAVKSQYLNLKLTGKSDDEIRKTLKDRFEKLAQSYSQFKSDDVFQLYMNVFTESFDPHTNYFLPITSDNFMIGMSQSLEGIGAKLQTDNEYTKVAEIIVGGPAYRSKLLFANDKIVGVAQGNDGPWVDVIGWRIDEVVKLIRGPKDSVVRLQIIKADATPGSVPIEIVLVRDKVKIEEQAPKKEVISLFRNNKQYKIGVITVPSFYLDFEGEQQGDPDYKSTTRDVKKLLAELKRENIDGLVVDLRNNGGGSLAEAVNLSGLFIPDGPVVQIRNASGQIEIQRDEDKDIYYDGPLGILINRFSASASEIFSGAIQDYKRGVIVGEQSYGKGTVQNLLDLQRFINSSENSKPGELKMTLAKFYRVNGSSTQLKGVTPDISLPSAFSAQEYGESSESSALPWDLIQSTRFQPTNFLDSELLSDLISKHQTRMNTDSEFVDLSSEIEQLKIASEKKEISLNFDQRKIEQQKEDTLQVARTRLSGTITEGDVPKEPKKDTDIHDPYLKESLNVIADWLSYRIG
jgi:carboxyl-terminal processing protease